MKLWELLSSKRKWCVKAAALDSMGKVVFARNKMAVRWCLWGGLQRCYPLDELELAARKLLDAIRLLTKFVEPEEAVGYGGLLRNITMFNDTHPWAVIRRVLRKARM